MREVRVDGARVGGAAWVGAAWLLSGCPAEVPEREVEEVVGAEALAALAARVGALEAARAEAEVLAEAEAARAGALEAEVAGLEAEVAGLEAEAAALRAEIEAAGEAGEAADRAVLEAAMSHADDMAAAAIGSARGYCDAAVEVSAAEVEAYADAAGAAAEGAARLYTDAAKWWAVDEAAVQAEQICDAAVAPLVEVIAVDTVWRVSTAAGLAQAVADLDGYHIAAGVRLEIEVAPGVYRMAGALEIAHPDGSRVEIVGDVADPAQVVLEFSGTDGISVEAGASLGYVGGLTLSGNDNSRTAGVRAGAASVVVLGPLDISDFDEGISADANAAVIAATSGAAWLQLDSNRTGAAFTLGAAARLDDVVITGSALYGLSAQQGAEVEADNVQVSGSSGMGVQIVAARARLDGAISTGNSGDGFNVTQGGALISLAPAASLNNGNGFDGASHSLLYLSTPSNSGNAQSAYRITDNAYAWLSAPVGDLSYSAGSHDLCDLIDGLGC